MSVTSAIIAVQQKQYLRGKMFKKLTQLQKEYLSVLGIAINLSIIAIMFQSVIWLSLFALSGAIFSLVALAIVIASQGIQTLKPVKTER